MRLHIKKFISVLIALLMLAQSTLPLHAQFYSAPASFGTNYKSDTIFDSEKFRINTKFSAIGNTLSYEAYKFEVNSDKDFSRMADIPEQIYQALYFNYKAAIVAEEEAVSSAYNHINKLSVKDAIYTAYNNKYKDEAGNICHDGKCFDNTIYNLALLRFLLRYGAGLSETNKDWRWNGDIMLEHAKEIYYIVSDYGISANDTALARKYFRYLINKTGKYCDNDIYMADIAPGLAGGEGKADARTGKERRKNYCEKLGFIALSLGYVENISAAEKDADAELLYKELKSNYKEDYGAIVLGNYVTALLMTGNNRAYELLEKFLLKDSLNDGLRKGNFWQIAGHIFDIISIKHWVDSYTDINNQLRGRGGRYLNEVGLRFQYIDEDAAKKLGYSDFSISLVKDGHSGYNMPYGNILEDIGVLLSQWPDARAAAIINKAVNKYAMALMSGEAGYSYVHTPLITGAIKGGGVKSSNTSFVINKLYSLDWWDLNEGTQRRINNIMAEVSQSYGAGYKAEKSKNEVKLARATRNGKIEELAVWGDILVSAVLITTFVASIPSLARGASSFIKTFRASRAVKSARIAKIRAAGKADLLKKVHVNIKSSGVNPAKIKPFVQKKTAPAPSGAVKNAKESSSLSSMANKHRAANKSNTKTPVIKTYARFQGDEGSAQVILKQSGVKINTDIAQQSKTLTAVIGEGGGGAATEEAATLSRFQRAFNARQEAAKDLSLTEEAFELLQPVKSQPFKGGWFFNKPYKELPKWKQFAFNQYFSWMMSSADIAGQTITGALRNPGKAAAGLTLSGAPAVNLINPTVIVAPVSQAGEAALRTAYSFSDAANTAVSMTRVNPALTTIKVFTNTSAATAASTLQTGFTAPKVLSIFAVPQLEGILNEFHGGPSADMRIKPSSYSEPLISAKESTDKKEIYTKVNKLNLVQGGNGFLGFEHYADEMIKKRNNHKINKDRYRRLMGISKYISPKLTNELLNIIDQNPYGHETFDTFFEAVAEVIPALSGTQIITLGADKLPAVKNAPLEDWEVKALLEIDDNPLDDMFDYVGSSGNYMIESLKKRSLELLPFEQTQILNRLIDIKLASQEAGAPKKSYLIGTNGNNYEWEDFSDTNMVQLALGKEVKKDLIKELSLKKGETSYKHFLSKHKEWLISQLGATQEKPAIWFKNAQDTYFIYSNDGSRRIRIGGHELLLSRKTNFHFHLEYRNITDGNWTGPVNYVYSWPEQNLLPSDITKDMIKAPIDYMAQRGLIIEKTDFNSPSAAQTPVQTEDKSKSSIDFLSFNPFTPEALKFIVDPVYPSDIQSYQQKQADIQKRNSLPLTQHIHRSLVKLIGITKKNKTDILSGFFINHRGVPFIVTSSHFLPDINTFKVYNYKDELLGQADVFAKVDDYTPSTDIALLMPKDINLDYIEPLELARGNDEAFSIYKFKPGAPLNYRVFGFPEGNYDFKDTYIQHSFFPSGNDMGPVILTPKVTMHGYSGGPMINKNTKRVVGAAHGSNSQNSAFASAETIREFINNTLKKKFMDASFNQDEFFKNFPRLAANYKNIINKYSAFKGTLPFSQEQRNSFYFMPFNSPQQTAYGNSFSGENLTVDNFAGFEPSLIQPADAKYKQSIFGLVYGGSGFTVERNGSIYAVTSLHNISLHAPYTEVFNYDGDIFRFELIYKDTENDIAILKLPPAAVKSFKPLKLYEGAIQEEQKLYSLGFLSENDEFFATDNRYVLASYPEKFSTTFNFGNLDASGYCGSPLLLQDPQTGEDRVAGLHCGSKNDHTKSYARSSAMILKDIDALHPRIKLTCKIPIENTDMQSSSTSSVRKVSNPSKPLANANTPRAGKFKGWEKSLIPNMTMKGLSYEPSDKDERKAFYEDINNNLVKHFGSKDYLSAWRKAMLKYDVEPYKQGVFMAVANDEYNGTAFLTEYLGMKLILTNTHIVGKSRTIRLADYKGRVFEAEVIAKTTDRDGLDLAMLLPKDAHILEDYTPLELSLRKLPGLGTELYVIGYPGNGHKFIKKGMLMVEDDYTGRYPAINLVPSVYDGTSGSPLMMPAGRGALGGINGKDAVVGIAHIGTPVNSLFIPSSTIKSFIKKSVRLGLSNPDFDNNIFYNAGLFKGAEGLKNTFLLDDSFWNNNLLNGNGLPRFGRSGPGSKIADEYLPIILTAPKEILK